jgi:drug/metabolite transporter (DMT)-like permease
MITSFGLIAAFIAFLAWGFGDFAIQRSVKAVGAVPALFFIGLFGFVGLLPFVWNDIPLFFSKGNIGILLIVASIVTFAYAVFFFESLHRGKLSVVEPVMSFELPVTIAIGIFLINERLTSLQLILTCVVFCGLIFTIVRREPHHWWQFFRKRTILEQGVVLAVIATVLSGSANVLTGVLSQQSKPLLAIWGINSLFGLMCLVWMIIQKDFKKSIIHAKTHWKPIVMQGILDNIAWVGFATAVLVLPISVTIAITESYIALAAILGIIINKERLQKHQYIGIAITLVAAVALAVVTEI